MVNHDHPTHVPCLFSMMMSEGSRLSLSNQSLFSFPDPFLIWVVDQFHQRHSPDLTESSPLQYLYSFVMLIQWNCVFLPRRRFVFGAFPWRRWFFRLSTGDCPLTQGYGGFTWVFDPGINRVLAEDEDIIKLVETKKNSQTQWINSGDPVPLFGHSIPEFPAHRYPRSMLKDLRLATKRELTAHPMIPEKYLVQRKASSSQCFVHDYMRRRPHMMILHQPFMNVILEYDASEDEFGFLLKIDEASTSPRWPLVFWDWVLVYLGSQVDSMNGMSDFKKIKHLPWQQIWVIRQRRLPTDQSESFPESSNVLISTKRQDTVLSPTTSSHFKSKVMLKAFWSLSSKLIANNKYVKEGHNRFHLLARKAFDSRVTLHSFIEIVSISYICVQWLFCIYYVPCKLL
ncbi:hypothetical protein ARALYDRAFT_915604 [Arabidopsis lyrata subsp. lyrata]|uniref:Uncharacterized protein n=1 Tax=Arabidopsis lyrata subsp. lyrata TaxID=81972 RepID=D7MHK0_ARALL|nr:hypothetical protein ARALYDRAFT_915604 [Arabidopsis lyrata subsp. lyrata]